MLTNGVNSCEQMRLYCKCYQLKWQNKINLEDKASSVSVLKKQPIKLQFALAGQPIILQLEPKFPRTAIDACAYPELLR